jgi:hypothetical protein
MAATPRRHISRRWGRDRRASAACSGPRDGQSDARAFYGRGATTLAWFPEIDADPAGLPDVQARFDLRPRPQHARRRSGRRGISTWRLDTERPFVTGPPIAPSAWGDVMLDIRVLQRAGFLRRLHDELDRCERRDLSRRAAAAAACGGAFASASSIELPLRPARSSRKRESS